MTTPIDLLSVADSAVDSVVPELRDALGSELSTETKSSGTDMVTEMDRWSEATLTEHIRTRRPTDGFLGEEGTVEGGS